MIPSGVYPYFKFFRAALPQDWLSIFLPHVLQKINRVTYGIMTDAQVPGRCSERERERERELVGELGFAWEDSTEFNAMVKALFLVVGAC